MSKCAQCENPNLKGIHTCMQQNQFNQTGRYLQASMQEILRRQHGRDDLLRRLLDLNEVERDRVLRAIGV